MTRRLLAAVTLLALPAGAAQPERLVEQLSNPKEAQAAVDALTAMGAPAVKHLVGEAAEGRDLSARGWAIVALSQIGGPEADSALKRLHERDKAPGLVRTWAAAARVRMATTGEVLLELAKLRSAFPALERPLKIRFTELAGEGGLTALDLLTAVGLDASLAAALGPAILAAGPEQLVQAMATHPDQNARRTAAGYLATLGQQGKTAAVGEAVVRAYAFVPGSTAVPWKGGPLFVPGLAWPPAPAKELAGALVSWMVWAHERGDAETHQQIHNNLRSLELARAAGYTSPGWQNATVEQWLAIWAQVIGAEGVNKLLAEQGSALKLGAAR